MLLFQIVSAVYAIIALISFALYVRTTGGTK